MDRRSTPLRRQTVAARADAPAALGMTRLRAAKTLLFAALAVPTLQVAYVAYSGAYDIGTRAQTILEISGVWSMWFLVAVLAVRPARDLFGLPVLIRFRRMIGLYAAWYAAVHTVAYIYDNDYRWTFIWREIVEHPFLSTGAVAVALLVPLVLTSTDGMVRRLGGRRWRRLQRIVYAVLVVAVLHYVLSVRLSPSEPILQAGLIGWLLHYRLIVYWRRRRGRAAVLTDRDLAWTGALWVVATGLLELWYFDVNTSIDLGAVLRSYLSPAGGLRPATVALLIMIATAALRLAYFKLIRPRKD